MTIIGSSSAITAFIAKSGKFNNKKEAHQQPHQLQQKSGIANKNFCLTEEAATAKKLNCALLFHKDYGSTLHFTAKRANRHNESGQLTATAAKTSNTNRVGVNEKEIEKLI